MNNNLQGFDPLLFLGITNLKDEEKNIVSQKILVNISNYIFVRMGELLEEDDLKNIDNPDELFDVAKSKIPDLPSKIKLFLEDFKKDYYNNYNNPAQI